MRHRGGVLSELQDGWMLRPVLTPRPQASGAVHAAAHSASVGPSSRTGFSAATLSEGQAVTKDNLSISTDSVGSQEAQRQPLPHAMPPRIRDGLVSRVMPVMTIMDLEIGSDVVQRAQLGTLGWDTSALFNLHHLNAAYGYISQVTIFLSVVLDVPLLYHIELQGSHCSIRQAVPDTSHHGSLQRGMLEVRATMCFKTCCHI
jgi:hypothetical protein